MGRSLRERVLFKFSKSRSIRDQTRPKGRDANNTVSSGKCLEVLNGSLEDLGAIVQYPCHGEDNQLFKVIQRGKRVEIVSKSSAKYLDVLNGSNDDGAPIVQFECHGGTNQRWARIK